MTSPYDFGAPLYLDAGWTGVLPLPPGEKSPPPTGYTGHHGRDPHGPMIDMWRKENPDGNICIHLPDGVVGIDVDHYGNKTGADTLARLEAELGPLPRTYASTSRPDTPSGIRWFRVEPGMHWPTGPGKDIEFIHKGHRYAVVWPSVHPDGRPYVWIDHNGDEAEPPIDDQLAWMPDEWQARFTGGAHYSEQPEYRQASEQERSHCLTDGAPCYAVTKVLNSWTERTTVKARHDAMLALTYSLARLGEQGHKGVLIALTEFYDTFTAEVGPDRKDGSEKDEYKRAVNGAIAKVSQDPTPDKDRRCCGRTASNPVVENPNSLLLPAEWYEERPLLKEIRQYAHDHCAGADAVLYATMARLSAMISPRVRIDTGILSPASCNLFVAAMGPAGSGKSSSASLAKRLYIPNSNNFPDGIPIGSGEGLVETYFGMVNIEDPSGATYADGRPKQIKVKQQIRDAAFFVTDEGQRLVKLMDKPGSILADTIREMWVAATTGQGNANAETRRILDEHTYSCGMLVGFQPPTVQDLLKDWAGGTPQRFVYCWVSDPNIPDEPAPRPPKDPFATVQGSRELRVQPGNIEMVQSVRDEIRATHMARTRGLEQVDPMDAHDYLTKAKLAAILTLMDGRHTVEDDDWRLAGAMYQVSSNVRTAMVQYGQQHSQDEMAERNKSYAVREGMAESARQQAREDHGAPWRVAKNIAKKVHDDGLTTIGAVNRKLARRDQNDHELLDAAWEVALDEGWVLVAGNDVQPGEQRPS